MKPPAICLLRMYERLNSILPHILAQSDYNIVVDFELPENLASEQRIVHTDSFTDKLALRQKGVQAAQERIDEFMKVFFEHFSELPYAKNVQKNDYERMREEIFSGLVRLFEHAQLMEEIVQRHDVRCLGTSPTHIPRSQAVIAVAKKYNIPSVHIPHGTFADVDNWWPEPSDFFLKSDELGKKTFEETQVSQAQPIVTGVPFAVVPTSLPPEQDEAQRQAAKLQLELPVDAQLLVFMPGGYEGLYAAPPVSSFRLAQAFAELCRYTKERDQAGKATRLVVRQHPTLRRDEDTDAFLSVAFDVGAADHCQVINDQKEHVIDAADIIVTGSPKSSVIFDVFARRRATVCLNVCAQFPHPFVDGDLKNYVRILPDLDTIANNLSSLLDSSHERDKLAHDGHAFLTGIRTHTGEMAAECIAQTLIQIAEKNISTVNNA